MDSKRGGIKWRCWKSCFRYRSPAHLIPTSGHTQACVPGFHSTSLIPQCCWTTHKPGWFMDLVLAPSPFKMCHLLPGGPGPFREQQCCSATVAEAPPRDTACHPSHRSGLKSQTNWEVNLQLVQIQVLRFIQTQRLENQREARVKLWDLQPFSGPSKAPDPHSSQYAGAGI